jgi:hypothetical protein
VLNREWLALGAQEGIKVFATEGLKLLEWFKQVGPKLDSFTASLKTFKTVAKVVGVVLAVALIAPLVAVVGAIGLVPTLLIAAGVAVVAFADEIGAAMVNAFDAFVAPFAALKSFIPGFETGSAAPGLGGGAATAVGSAAPELNGAIRLEVAGAEASNVTADMGGVGVNLEQASNMPVD